ncbi:AMP-binding protein [Nonomuraea sp. RK-328]|nr:AMP-binding protein [Nonomuraea sp. RK-328]
MLLHDVLARRAAAHPAAPAFTVDGLGTLDYLGWHLGARRVAAGLAARGLRPGERVVLAFEDGDWLSFAVCFVGVLAAGGVAVPVRAPIPEAHLLATAAQAEAAGLVTGGGRVETGAFGGWRAGAGDLTATTRGADEAGAVEVGAVGLTGADPAAVILTSGTTGAAKAVLSIHASLVEDWPDEGEDPDEVLSPQANALFTSVAIGTNAAQSVLKSCLANGVHIVLGQPFAPERLAGLIEEHRVSALSLVPTTARLAVSALRGQGHAPSRVRSVVSSSAPLDQPTVAGLAEVFPRAEIFNVYTVAEGGAGLQHRCGPDRPPALGRLGPDARLVGSAGQDVAPGEVGELWLRHTGPALTYLRPSAPSAVVAPAEPDAAVPAHPASPAVADGESSGPRGDVPAGAGDVGAGHAPEGSREAASRSDAGTSGMGTRYLPGGWIATGDLCRRDADGLVYFVERADDVIVSGGLNVASATVEAALRTHPAVAEVAVFGVPHAALGRAVVAAVVLTASVPPASAPPTSAAPASVTPASTTPEAGTLAALRDHCARRLPRDHVPVDVVPVVELPVTPNGKVRKRLLAEWYARTCLEDGRTGTAAARLAGAPFGQHPAPPEQQPAQDEPGQRDESDQRDELDEVVFAVFRDTLDAKRIRRDSDFYRLGGHSLLAPMVAAELERRIGRPVEPTMVLRHPRAGDLADALRRAPENAAG